MAKHGVTFARVALGIVFFWFGALQFLPGLSPAEQLAGRTIERITFGMMRSSVALPILATWECVIGIVFQSSSWVRESALLPQFFPNPDPVGVLDRQGESELMCQHTHLPAMMGVVRNHVCHHGCARRPRSRPSIPTKGFDAALGPGQSGREHFATARRTFGQRCPRLLLRTATAVERGREP